MKKLLLFLCSFLTLTCFGNSVSASSFTVEQYNQGWSNSLNVLKTYSDNNAPTSAPTPNLRPRDWIS